MKIYFISVSRTSGAVFEQLAKEFERKAGCEIIFVSDKKSNIPSGYCNLIITSVFDPVLQFFARATNNRFVRKNFYLYFAISLINLLLLYGKIQSNTFQLSRKISSKSKIILYGDRHRGIEPAAIKIALQKGIQMMIPSLSGFAFEEVILKVRRLGNKWEYDVSSNSRFCQKYKRQFRYDNATGRKYSFYPVWMTYLLDYLNCISPNPWIIGSQNIADICVLDRKVKKTLVENGVNENRVFVVGSFFKDILFSNLARRGSDRPNLYSKYNLDNKSGIVLVGLPPLVENGLVAEFESVDIFSKLFSLLTSKFCNVLITLHPSMNANQYRWLEEEFDVIISREETHSILPLVDLYIVNLGSTTATWSQNCSIETILLDWFDLHYSSFWIADTTFVSKDIKSFATYLDKFELKNWKDSPKNREKRNKLRSVKNMLSVLGLDE